MGIYVDLYKIDFDNLVNKLMKIEQIDDKEMLEKILLTFGDKINNYYILLNNELYDEYNSYYNLVNFIDTYFNIPDDYEAIDSHKIILEIKKEMNCNVGLYDAEDKLGLELDWDEEY